MRPRAVSLFLWVFPAKRLDLKSLEGQAKTEEPRALGPELLSLRLPLKTGYTGGSNCSIPMMECPSGVLMVDVATVVVVVRESVLVRRGEPVHHPQVAPREWAGRGGYGL